MHGGMVSRPFVTLPQRQKHGLQSYMTIAPEASSERVSLLDSLAVYLRPRVLTILFLGFSAGLPLAL